MTGWFDFFCLFSLRPFEAKYLQIRLIMYCLLRNLFLNAVVDRLSWGHRQWSLFTGDHWSVHALWHQHLLFALKLLIAKGNSLKAQTINSELFSLSALIFFYWFWMTLFAVSSLLGELISRFCISRELLAITKPLSNADMIDHGKTLSNQWVRFIGFFRYTVTELSSQ